MTCIQPLSRTSVTRTNTRHVNRMLGVLRASLRRAANEWEWLDKAPQPSRLENMQRMCSVSGTSSSRRSARRRGRRGKRGPPSRIFAGTTCPPPTWASWRMQHCTPLFAPQELGGWESAEMVRHYAHLSADHLAPDAAQLPPLLHQEQAAMGACEGDRPGVGAIHDTDLSHGHGCKPERGSDLAI